MASRTWAALRSSSSGLYRPCSMDPASFRRLCDTDRLRASKLQHAIQRKDCDANFSRPARIRARPQCVPDHPFVSIDIGLNQRTPVVARRFLPGHSAALANELQLLVGPPSQADSGGDGSCRHLPVQRAADLSILSQAADATDQRWNSGTQPCRKVVPLALGRRLTRPGRSPARVWVRRRSPKAYGDGCASENSVAPEITLTYSGTARCVPNGALRNRVTQPR